jgi:serine/threonine-protein kinase RsbW
MSQDADPKVIAERHELPGSRETMDFVQSSILSSMEKFGYCEDDLFAVRIAVEEAIANAVLHGHRGNQSQLIDMSWTISQFEVEIIVLDGGRGYDQTAVPDPTLDENLTLPSGRGLAMIHAFMTEVEITESGKKIRMKRRKQIEQ